MPSSSSEWIDTNVPARGELQDDIYYVKHGSGCTVNLSDGEVDFDFGDQGEIGGFDEWRLVCFARHRTVEYGFENEDAVKQCFKAALAEGTISYSGHILYYVTDAPRSLAVDVDSILPGDSLPRRDQDPVLVLYAHYFLAANLMRENYKKLDVKWKRIGYLSPSDSSNLGIYISSWLGFLAVTCEGFEKLKIRLLL